MAFDFFAIAKKATQIVAGAGAATIVNSIVKNQVHSSKVLSKITVPVATWFIAGILIDAVQSQVEKEFDEGREILQSIKELKQKEA